MSDDFIPPEPSQTTEAWVRSFKEGGRARDVVDWQASQSTYVALENLKRHTEAAAKRASHLSSWSFHTYDASIPITGPKPSSSSPFPPVVPQRSASTSALCSAAANVTFGLLPYNKRVPPSKARKLGPQPIVLPTASQNDFPHFAEIARGIMDEQQLLKKRHLEKMKAAEGSGTKKTKAKQTKDNAKRAIVPVARAQSDGMVDRTNTRSASPRDEDADSHQEDYASEPDDSGFMDIETRPLRPSGHGSIRSNPPQRLNKSMSIVMGDPESEPEVAPPPAVRPNRKRAPSIGSDTEPCTPEHTPPPQSRRDTLPHPSPEPFFRRSLSPEIPYIEDPAPEPEPELLLPLTPPRVQPQGLTRIQAMRPAPKSTKSAPLPYFFSQPDFQLPPSPEERAKPKPPREPSQHRQSRHPPPSQTPPPSQRAPPPLGMRRYASGGASNVFRPSQDLPTKRKGFKTPFAHPVVAGAPSTAAVTKASTSKAKATTEKEVPRVGVVEPAEYAARVNLNVTSEPSSSFLGRSFDSEVALDADSSYGDISMDLDELEAVVRQYD